MLIIMQARYRRILLFFAGIIINTLWWDLFLPRLGFRTLAIKTREKRLLAYASAYRKLAIRMGGVMIKIGQFLSSRVDVLPVEVTTELSGLQDEVAAERFEDLRLVIESDFGCPLEQKFSYFDPQPLAAASIGQVHRARLKNPPVEIEPTGEDRYVVVKVQRPRIQYVVDVDLSALQVVSGWINLYRPIRKRANVPALMREFSRSLYAEMDYLAEGKNAEIFARNFLNNEEIRVPDVFWSHTTRHVLTLEDVMAIKITDYALIEAAGVNRAEVAKRLFDTYLMQIFDHRFFHADPHPGNLFVFPGLISGNEGKIDWKLVFVDFGMVGEISQGQFLGMREMLIGVVTRDMKRVIKAYQLMEVLLPDADLELLERAGIKFLDHLWGKTVPQMMETMHGDEGRKFVHQFSELMIEMPFQMPQNMILFGRCLAILSGLCTGLSPEFNVFTSLEPYARKLLAEDGENRLDTLLKEVTRYGSVLLSIPGRAVGLLERVEQGRLEVRTPGLESQMGHVNRSVRRLSWAIVFFSLVIGAVQLHLAGEDNLAKLLVGSGLFILIWILLA